MNNSSRGGGEDGDGVGGGGGGGAGGGGGWGGYGARYNGTKAVGRELSFSVYSSTSSSSYSNAIFSHYTTKRIRRSNVVSAFVTRLKDKNRSELITQAISNVICEDMLSINTAEYSGFRKLMNVKEPSYMVSCSKTTTTRIQGQCNEKVYYIKEKLMILNSVALNTDCWTFRNLDS